MEFDPMLTPKEMLHKGIFGGTYFSKLINIKDFPSNWFDKIDKSYESESKSHPANSKSGSRKIDDESKPAKRNNRNRNRNRNKNRNKNRNQKQNAKKN